MLDRTAGALSHLIRYVVSLLVTRSRLALSNSPASRTIGGQVFSVWGRVVRWRCVFGAWLAVAGCLAWAKDMALVSNKSNGVTEVSMAELVKICKGQTSRWPKGKPVTFFSLNPAATEMKLVLEKVYGVSSDEVSALISNANHGRANHPAIVVVNSDKAVVEAVESTPGAVGLVDVYSITGGITVLRIESKLPLESGYPLHGN